MKTLQQIKDEYSYSFGFASWDEYLAECCFNTAPESDTDQIAKLYANESLLKLSENIGDISSEVRTSKSAVDIVRGRISNLINELK
jgi:hypothetical protein